MGELNPLPINAQVCFEICRWHIDRYDRLRGAVATRASVVLSANALLLAGVALIANRYSNERPLIVVALVLTVGLTLRSVVWCLPTLVSLKDDRAVYGVDLDRGAFGWSKTIRDFPIGQTGVDAFVSKMSAGRYEDLLADATRELWVGIHQHAMRYRALRRAILWLRAAVLAFGAFLVLAIIVGNS